MCVHMYMVWVRVGMVVSRSRAKGLPLKKNFICDAGTWRLKILKIFVLLCCRCRHGTLWPELGFTPTTAMLAHACSCGGEMT